MSKVSIAVIGLNGFLGKPVVDAIESGKFDDKIQFPIKAVTRKEKPSTSKIEYVVAQLDDEHIDDVAAKLKGTDVIIELVAPNPQLFLTLEKVAAKVQPKLYIPSQFGVDILQIDAYARGFLAIKTEHSTKLRESGLKVVDFVTGFFAEPGAFLYEIVGVAGIDPATKTITQRGSPDSKISITKLPDIGYSLVSLLTQDPATLPDTVRISSQVITLQDVIDKYEANHDVKLSVVKTISKEDTLKDFQDRLAAGFNFADFFFYLQAVATQGLDKGVLFSEVHNELVNPGESLFKWGKF